MSHTPYMVGICGGSGSGKTFLLHQLSHHFAEKDITFISQDNYYKPLEEQAKLDGGLVNFDHPTAMDHGRLARDLQHLIHGERVHLTEYTFNNPEVTPRQLTYRPAPLIVIEGLHVLHHPPVRQLIDLKIFVDADDHIKLARRLRRDLSERGYSHDSVLRDYEKFAAPMFKKYVEPLKMECDLIIPNNVHMYKAVQVLCHHLEIVLNGV